MAASKMAAEHIWPSGHRLFVFREVAIGDVPPNLCHGGYHKRLAECSEELTDWHSAGEVSGGTAERLFIKEPLLAAFFYSNHNTDIGVIAALRLRGSIYHATSEWP